MSYKIIQKTTCLLLFVVCLFTSLAAAPRVTLRFTSKAELPTISLMLPLLQGAKQVPLKGLEVYRYTFSRPGGETWNEDLYDPYDLWIEMQHGACWVDTYGHTLRILRMTHRYPNVFTSKHVARETFTTAINNPDMVLKADSNITFLTEWIEFFTAEPVIGAPTALQINRSRLANLIEFKLENPNMRAYAFRLNPSFPGQANAPREWFAVVFEFADQNIVDLDRTIREKFLAEIKTTSNFEMSRAQSVNKNRTPKNAGPLKEHHARTAAQKSVELLDDWWYMDSMNYIMLSNDPTAERFSLELLQNLEKLLPYFESAIPPFAESLDSVGVVRLFKEANEYADYLSDANIVGMSISQTAGIFSGSRRELVIRPVSSGGNNRDNPILRILKHEGFHQYLFLAHGGIESMPWFNEGHAVYFESCGIDNRGKFAAKESEIHLATITQLVNNRNNDWEKILNNLLYSDYRAFYSGHDTSYALGYGLVYYLRRGAPLEPNKPYAKILPTYLETLERTKNAKTATAEAFKEVDMKKFSDNFVDFWKTQRKRQQAERLEGI